MQKNEYSFKSYPASLRQVQDWVNNENLKSNQNAEILSFRFEKSNLDINALESSIKVLFKRHESLRTFFVKQNEKIFQCVLNKGFEVFSLVKYTENQYSEEDILILCSSYMKKLKNIKTLPLCYFILFKTSQDSFLFICLIHHIISDFDSIEILKREINLLYKANKNNTPYKLPILPLQLKDFFQHENQRIKEKQQQHIKYWKKKLEFQNLKEQEISFPNKKLEFLDLSSGKAYFYITDCNALKIITTLKKKYSFSYGAIINTAFFIMLGIIKKQNDFLIASPITGRNSLKSQSIIGNLMGGIYYHKRRELKTSTKNIIKDFQIEFYKSKRHIIYNHESLDLSGIELRVNCDLYLNIINQKLELIDKTLKTHSSIGRTYYPLECWVVKSSEELVLNWQYNSFIYSEKEIENMASMIKLIIKNLLCNLNKNPFSKTIWC
ncbi:condensation domain-containing protein [Sinomicrobium oceani]|uniref:condensation domain-containing protein n=1 Tax=Sinomicrobium oceani TaxID=1150368 RepID=UPI00227CA868|nr:condensation domain-containing protein [Sinomicrobium oceani]